MAEVGDLLSLIWITKEFPALWKTSDIVVCFEIVLWGKRAECVKEIFAIGKGVWVASKCTGLSVFCWISMSSPLQRFWPSAEKWLSVTVLVAKFVHLENRVERVYTGQFLPQSSQECASGI